MMREFRAFLIKQNVVALAIAVVIGVALNGVVQAFVDGFIMPFVALLTPSGNWRESTLDLGPVALGVGPFLAATLNFVIVGLVAWRVAKLFIPPEPAVAAPATKTCGFCRMTIDAAATRCAHCTSQLAGAI